jgi:hypothetical protein
VKKLWQGIEKRLRSRAGPFVALILVIVLARWNAGQSIGGWQFWFSLVGLLVALLVYWNYGHVEGFKKGQRRLERLFALAGVSIVRDKDGHFEAIRYPRFDEGGYVLHKPDTERIKEVNHED